MKLRFIAWIITWLILTVLPRDLQADAHDQSVITLYGIKDYQPYSYYQEGVPHGLYNDIVLELFSRAGYPIKNKLVPFRRLLLSVEKGEVAGMVGVFQTPEREQYSTYLLDFPLTKIEANLYVPSSSPIQSSKMDEISSHAIGVKSGFVYSSEFEMGAKSGLFKKKEVETIDQLVKMLLLGRLDGIVHMTGQTNFYLDRLDLNRTIRMLQPPITDGQNTYIAFSNKALETLPKDFLSKIQSAAQSMRKEGRIKALHEKHNISHM